MYSIKAVSQATGLTVETLRAWERRYRVVVPQRDDSGRRVYRAEDVLRLRRLREATERGHPIGRLVHLDDVSLARLLHEPERAPRSATATTERLVSSAVRKHIGLIVESLARTARRPAIVFATLPGERHELGLLMAAMVCASHGCRVHYLGPDLPAEEIARYARQVEADVVAVSLVLTDTLAHMPAELAAIRAALGPDVPIWVGGAAAQGLERTTLPAGCLVISNQGELAQRLDVLHA
jgi:MerR family transcriptional regulator, light-induced transcriptional regulator